MNKGKQPCDNYRGQLEANMHAMWVNVHECFCKDKEGNYCPSTVSFCENCKSDHHNDGFETCVCFIKEKSNV